MCNPMSGVLTKDRAFWSMHTDSHHEIIAEHKLCESIGNHSPATCKVLLMKFELNPPGGNFAAPLKDWVYVEDQDIMPEWYDRDKCEKRARQALKEWHKGRVILKDPDHPLKGGYFYVYNSTVEVWDNSTVEAMGNSTVKARGNSTVKARDNSTVEAWGNSTVEAMGNSTVEVWGNSTVEAWGNSTVKARGNSTVKARDNSTVEAWGNSTVEAMGNSTVEAMGNSTVVAMGNSTVEAWGNSTVNSLCGHKLKTPPSELAVHIDRSTTPPAVTCGWLVSKGKK